MTFGREVRDTPAKVFMTVIQPDGTFKPVEKLWKTTAALLPSSGRRKLPENNVRPRRRFSNPEFRSLSTLN